MADKIFADSISGIPEAYWLQPDGTYAKTIAPANKATYVAVATGYAAYATPTDIFSLFGSATKLIKVTKFAVLIQTTAAAPQTLDLVKRSTANTGGTPTVLTAVPYDSTLAAATATARTYGAAPSALGTLVGLIRTDVRNSGTLTASSTAIGDGTLGLANGGISAVSLTTPIILRGIAEGICLNYRGAALTAGFLASFIVEWTEE